ncbi:hypothetical protein Q9Q94_08860 [Uliginosibacterium sp. 31-16]|uniref:hypothetical protein n=1 Tax=Uliginosibacterium sp. 31-16 TaxID=3068315 RepID=UPI00273FC65B|nr:hypothetical protein [Uliginosibacterium sp. 31-16]MDP5239638.1 hypothetical protein [Uliginosibacterium sp. 31-16]
MTAALLPGLLLTLAGGLAIYLASPHQRWRARPLPARPARVGGSVLLAIAFIALSQPLQGVVAAFTLLTWLMLLWIALPYIGALYSPHVAKRKEGNAE